MRAPNRHLPTLLFVLILALGTTGAFTLGAHDEAAEDGLSTAETAQETQGDVDIDGAEHGEDVSEHATENNPGADAEADGCEFGHATAALASGRDLPGEAQDACENAGAEDLGTQGEGQGVSGEQTAEAAQEDGEEFGRTTADEARAGAGEDEQGDAGSEQGEARDGGQQFGSERADEGDGNAERGQERAGR